MDRTDEPKRRKRKNGWVWIVLAVFVMMTVMPRVLWHVYQFLSSSNPAVTVTAEENESPPRDTPTGAPTTAAPTDTPTGAPTTVAPTDNDLLYELWKVAQEEAWAAYRKGLAADDAPDTDRGDKEFFDQEYGDGVWAKAAWKAKIEYPEDYNNLEALLKGFKAGPKNRKAGGSEALY